LRNLHPKTYRDSLIDWLALAALVRSRRTSGRGAARSQGRGDFSSRGVSRFVPLVDRMHPARRRNAGRRARTHRKSGSRPPPMIADSKHVQRGSRVCPGHARPAQSVNLIDAGRSSDFRAGVSGLLIG
jgi:hypothetical protein